MPSFDQQLFYLINQVWTHPALDRFMAIITSWGLWLPVLIPLVIILFWRGGFKMRAMIFCAGLCIAVGDGIVTQLGKDWVQRPRPSDSAPVVRLVSLAKAQPGVLAVLKAPSVEERLNFFPAKSGRSFPSGHALNNIMIATVVMLFYPLAGWIFLPLTFAVGYSRIYTGSHWPSDVALSFVLGAGIALLITGLAEMLWRRFAPKRFPALAARHPGLLPEGEAA